MTLPMVMSLWAQNLLEEEHTTTVSLGIDHLAMQVEYVNYQETGVGHSQHVLVSNAK